MADADPRIEIPRTRQFALAVCWTTVRIIAGLALIALILVLVPKQPDATLALPVVIALVAVVLYTLFFMHQLRGVQRAKFPGLRAVEALVISAAMFLAVFATVYLMISSAYPGSFTEQLDAFSSYYFALTVLATVGFGDITPVVTGARAVTMVQMAIDIVFIALLIRIVLGAAKRTVESRKTEKPH